MSDQEREKAKQIILEKLKTQNLTVKQTINLLREQGFEYSQSLGKSLSWALNESGEAFFNDQWQLELKKTEDQEPIRPVIPEPRPLDKILEQVPELVHQLDLMVQEMERAKQEDRFHDDFVYDCKQCVYEYVLDMVYGDRYWDWLYPDED